MLDFIDRFANERFKKNKKLKLASIWIGYAKDKKSLTHYLSASSPEKGQFVRDMGEEWFDHDFIAVEYQKKNAPIEQVVDALVDTLNAPEAVKQTILERCRDQGLTEANTTVCLMQHTYDNKGDKDFNGLKFVGSYEYEEPAAQIRSRYEHLFSGVPATTSVAELGEYAFDGALAQEAGLEGADISYYGDNLAEAPTLTAEAFFALPIVNFDLVLGDSAHAVYEACERAGLEKINAFISVMANDETPLDVDSEKSFCGLHYLGVFKTQYPE
ncbi:immunity 22 family protein [Advenella incenata]|jgi:hypothetical protein